MQMSKPFVHGSPASLGRLADEPVPFRQSDSSTAAPFRLQTIGRWIARRRQRNALRELDEHLLKDIGLSRDDALREAAKPFWQK